MAIERLGTRNSASAGEAYGPRAVYGNPSRFVSTGLSPAPMREVLSGGKTNFSVKAILSRVLFSLFRGSARHDSRLTTLPPSVRAYVPTPASAGELMEMGLSNIFNRAWQVEIQEAASRVGGLGDADKGFLAWSEKGFILFSNPGLSVEENRGLARISLELGVPMDELPARTDSSSTDPKIASWIQKFISQYDSKLHKFLQDPSQGLHLKDGRRHYGIAWNDTHGLPLSYDYNTHGGPRGFMERNVPAAAHVFSLLDGSAFFAPTTVAGNAARIFSPFTEEYYLLDTAIRGKVNPLGYLHATIVKLTAAGALGGASPLELLALRLADTGVIYAEEERLR